MGPSFRPAVHPYLEHDSKELVVGVPFTSYSLYFVFERITFPGHIKAIKDCRPPPLQLLSEL